MRMRSLLYRALTMAAVGLVAACSEDTPTKPSQPSPSQFAGIEVSGPDSLIAGQSAQFVANIRQVDGTTKSATGMPNLRWRSSNPSVMSVNNSGVATAIYGGYEVTITADITPLGAVQGTRLVGTRPRVSAALEVSQQATNGQMAYVFTVKLTELAGVAQTVTEVWLNLDDGWSGQCSWRSDKLGQTRLPANGTLELGPLTCGFAPVFDVEVSMHLMDDGGKQSWVVVRREL